MPVSARKISVARPVLVFAVPLCLLLHGLEDFVVRVLDPPAEQNPSLPGIGLGFGRAELTALAFAIASTALFPSQSRFPMRMEGPFSCAGTHRTETRSPWRSAMALANLSQRSGCEHLSLKVPP